VRGSRSRDDDGIVFQTLVPTGRARKPSRTGTSLPDFRRPRTARNHEEKSMKIAAGAVLVTGANRGVGQALVEGAVRRGSKRVNAGTRQPLAHWDGRVPPLTLDVTNTAQIQAAVEAVESLDVLINNAGLALYDDDLSERAIVERHLAVYLFGTLSVTQAFLPLLTRSRGAIVNVLSVAAFGGRPVAGRGVSVHAALTSPVDTDMPRSLDIPKSSPESVARAIFNGVEKADEEVFPDPMSASIAESWRSGAAKALECQLAAFVQAEPFTS
jgi:NADP-dependent 3-hydroxy acid dehydrogenase YdfG